MSEARLARRCLLAVALLAVACAPGGERVRVIAGAFAVPAPVPDQEPARGAWGEELKPGRKLIAVSEDLVERGMVPGSRVHIEGFPAKYVVAHRIPGQRRIEIFMGTDFDAARRFGERELSIYWVGP